MKKNNLHLPILFIFIILCWGSGWPATKVGLEYMTPLWYTVAKLLVGTLTMFTIVILAGKFIWPKRDEWPLILIIAIFQISLYLWFANVGLSYLPAGRASLLAYTTPIWVMPLSVFIFKEEVSPKRWLGFCLAISGLVILLSPGDMDWTKDTFFGSIMLMLAALSWAISMLCARYMKWTKSPLELIPWQLLIATLPIIVYAFFGESHVEVIKFAWTSPPVPLLLSLVYTGIIVTGLSYWCGLIINKEISPVVVSIGYLAVPVVSLIISAVFMHEAITLATGCAMALIFLGLACIVV